jgi:pyruvate formate lyase activating enzyme
MPEIKGFTKNSLLDWDGRIASLIFLPGCNFRCPYCHAAGLVAADNTLPAVPLGEVDDYLNKNHGWIDGVVISGGEPTLNAGLPGLIDHLAGCGVEIKLFTNGSRPDVLTRLLQSGSLAAVSMDIKAPPDERYAQAAGIPVDLDAIRASADVIMHSGIAYEFRTTVCPQVLGHDDVVDAARSIRGASLLILQQFRPVDCLDPAFEKIAPYEEKQLDRMAAEAGEFVEKCVVTK